MASRTPVVPAPVWPFGARRRKIRVAAYAGMSRRQDAVTGAFHPNEGATYFANDSTTRRLNSTPS